MKRLVWLLFLLSLPAVAAQEGTIKLLALAERSDGTTSGVVADLDLRVEPGGQRVYLETFPLTKITTQISMRFAQQVACRELDIDCSDRDFFFTIRALPGIVGGPSAGSGAAVLAASLIAGLPLRNDTAITGTINSGGVIGPVGGVKEKLTAASKAGVKRVLIPVGTREWKDNATNTTIDLVDYGKNLSVEVIEIATLLEALQHYTGKGFPQVPGEVVLEPRYLETMKHIAVDLCDRTAEIRTLLEDRRTNVSNTTELEKNAANMSARAEEAFALEQFYASASYCFRSNVQLKRAATLQRNWTENQIAKVLLDLRGLAANYSREVDVRPVSTITDVQTYMAVKERIFEVEDFFGEIVGKLNETKENAERLAYAEERLFSAVTWARFFNGNDTKFVVDAPRLRDSCMAKISEAEERINYVRSFLADSLGDARRELDKAYQDLSSGNHTLCLYKASKAKAEADVILGLVGIEEKQLDKLITLKLDIVKDAIITSQRKGVFPIIGYSYYEYANSLQDFDKYSTLLFAEYALEFSNLDIYFPRRKPVERMVWQRIELHLPWIALGIGIGLFLAVLYLTVCYAQEELRGRRR
jgi:uncharacterized protein